MSITYNSVGNSEDPINSEFVCTPGNNIGVTLLCDGFNDCGNGNDETTVLCESEHPINTSILIVSVSHTDKCRVPYYGGCSFTRECITSEADVNCGDCLPGFMEDPTNTTAGADCIRKGLYTCSNTVYVCVCVYTAVPDDEDCEEETRTRTRSRSRSRSQSSRSSSRRSSRSRSSSDSSRSSSSTTSRRGTKCKNKTGTRYTTPRRVIQQQNLSNNYYWSKILRKLHGLEY